MANSDSKLSELECEKNLIDGIGTKVATSFEHYMSLLVLASCLQIVTVIRIFGASISSHALVVLCVRVEKTHDHYVDFECLRTLKDVNFNSNHEEFNIPSLMNIEDTLEYRRKGN